MPSKALHGVFFLLELHIPPVLSPPLLPPVSVELLLVKKDLRAPSPSVCAESQLARWPLSQPLQEVGWSSHL
jgi:hypothetical protein